VQGNYPRAWWSRSDDNRDVDEQYSHRRRTPDRLGLGFHLRRVPPSGLQVHFLKIRLALYHDIQTAKRSL
jgi:hypothetical protein